MTFSEKGGGYAAIENSDEGIITKSSFTFTGSGTVIRWPGSVLDLLVEFLRLMLNHLNQPKLGVA